MSSRALAGMAVIFGIGLMALALNSGNLTGALFTDTETSTGNYFAVGAWPDLQIDHNFSYGCPLVLYSGTNDMVVQTGLSAVPTYVHPAWTANIPGATWIWSYAQVQNPGIDENATFVRTFYWNGAVGSANITIAGDNSYDIYLNDNLIHSGANTFGLPPYIGPEIVSIDPSKFQTGTNTLRIEAKNMGVPGSDYTSNPAGIRYKLQVQKLGCNLFPEQDLDGGILYNFSDVKAGDHSEDVYSIHLKYADAWACLLVKNKTDDENTRIDPEIDAGDTTDNPNGGELSGVMHLFGWLDTNQNGIYEPGESMLFKGSLSDIVSAFNITDSQTPSGPIVNGTVSYMGIAWCLGEFTGINTYNLQCDGEPVTDVAQTDKLTADFVFYAVQSANNGNFKCDSLREPQ
jgi:hypothetical protein